jgi:large subunit ribosomal protein L25
VFLVKKGDIVIPFNLSLRDPKVKAKNLREENLIPGVIYGGKQNHHVYAPLKEFKKVIHEAGRSNIINIDLNGKAMLSLFKDFQVHPLTSEFIHFDLLEVDQNKEVRVQVALKVTGTPKGVKEGGILEILQDSIEVVCKVKDIPTVFEIDVTELEIGFSIHLSSLKAPKGGRFTQDSTTVLAVVTGEVEQKTEETPEA